MKKIPSLITVSLLLVSLLASGAFAYTNEEIQSRIQDVLMEHHPTDTPQWWRALGPNAPGVIMSMYEQSSHTYHRIRLLQGLGWFDTPEAVDFLKKQADGASDDVLRNTAIRSVGFSQGAKEEDFISKFLSHPDPQTRYTAAAVLKSLKDPRADAMVEKYLKEEKTPWIAGKLKGELPRPTGKLTPVATSEDRLNPDFEGQWKGYWMLPRGASEDGLKSESAVVNIKIDSATSLTGEMLIVREGAGQTWKLDHVTGKATKISGSLVRKKVLKPGEKAPEPVPFEAELTDEAGSKLLELHARKIGAILIVRQNPAR